QVRRQHDVRPHLQELALPVLEHRRQEAAAHEVLAEGNQRLAVLFELLVVLGEASQRLTYERGGEEKQQSQRQAIVAQPGFHSAKTYGRAWKFHALVTPTLRA